jgi:DNA invertase Pin-like site-specific DNA recombinase
MKVVGYGRCSTAVDTRTPMGKAMAHMAVVFAELERDFIRSRTREALAVRRDHGVVLGRPRSTPEDVVRAAGRKAEISQINCCRRYGRVQF